MSLLHWLRSMRSDRPLCAEEVRRELHRLGRQHAATIEARDRVALDAVNHDSAAAKWSHLDEAVRRLEQRIRVLAAALPSAEAKEAEADRLAEARKREQLMEAFKQRTQDAQKFVDDVVASLPDGDVLTRARDLRNELRADAGRLQAWSNDVVVRRPLDPLEGLVVAMQHRINRVSRARWAANSPITLDGSSPAELANAAARVEALERRPHA